MEALNGPYQGNTRLYISQVGETNENDEIYNFSPIKLNDRLCSVEV